MNKIRRKLSVLMLAFALAFTTFVPMFGNEAYAEQGTSITSESEATSQINNSTSLSNGKYDSSKFKIEFFGGTGRAKWSCEEINVKNGKAFAKFQINKPTYTHIFTGYAKSSGESVDDSDMSEYYDSDADKILKDSVYKIENKTVEIPVNLNKKTHFAGRTTAMNEPHWVRYAYEIKIEEKPAVDQYKPINYTGMFKVIDAYMTKEGSQEFMNITLSREGYDYLFKGKYDEAVATGDDSSRWIGFTKRTDEKNVEYTDKDGDLVSDTTKDKYEYKIPVDSNDNFIPIMSRSKSKKIWYPRYIEINRQTKKLYAGDYYENNDLKLVNNDKKIKADSAQLYVVGVESSNNYSATVIAKMPNADFDKAKYVPARNKTEIDKFHDKEEEIALNGDNQFQFVFEKKSAFGDKQPVNKISNSPVKVSFHSKAEDKWYDSEMKLDTNTMTFSLGKQVVEPVNKDALKAAIANANKACEGIKESKDGKDIPKTEKWVTSEAKEALDAAIAKAKKVLDDPAALKKDVDKAVKDLNDAVETYKNNIKPGLKEDTAVKEQYRCVNHTLMFKIVDAYLIKEGNQEFLNITLSGHGYKYLFKGKYDEAVATGTDSSKWIKYINNTPPDGPYEFRIPISDGDKFFPIMSRSEKHQIWYPRYIQIDRQKKEIHAGDYYENHNLKVVNNDKKIKADSAELYINGVEASNNYSATVIAKMPNADFDKAKYVPARSNSELNKLHESEEEITLSGNNQFNFVFEKKTENGPEKPVNKISNSAVKVSFHSKSEDKWYNLEMMLDTKNMTFTLGNKIDAPKPPEQKPTEDNKVPGQNSEGNPSNSNAPQIQYFQKDNDGYNVIERNGVLIYQVGKSTGAAFRIMNLHLVDLDTVKIKGQGFEKTLKYGVDYTAREGSIIVDVKKSFLDTLPNGKYDVLIATKNNGVFAKSISIEGSNVKGVNTVKTGDSESILIFNIMLIGTLLSAVYVVKRKNSLDLK